MSASSSSDEDTDEEDDGHHGVRAKKRRRLAVPETLNNLFVDATSTRPADGRAATHQGRTRRVPHVEGNYATLVYLPVKASRSWRRCARSCAELLGHLACSGAAPSTLPVHLAEGLLLHGDEGPGTVENGLHVTLGPMVMLRQQFIRPFLDRIEKLAAAVASAPPLHFDGNPVILASCDVTEGGTTRFFAAVTIAGSAAPWLREMVAGVTETTQAFGLLDKPMPPESMQLHCSLAWTLADLRPNLEAMGAMRCESPWGVLWRIPDDAVKPSEHALPLQAPTGTMCVRVGERITSLRFPESHDAASDSSASSQA